MKRIEGQDVLVAGQEAPDALFDYSKELNEKKDSQKQSSFAKKLLFIFDNLTNFFYVGFRKKEPVATTLKLRTSVISDINRFFEKSIKAIKSIVSRK